MPSLFSRKRHESTPASTPPLPPPKEFEEHARAAQSNHYLIPPHSSTPRSNPNNSYSHSYPTPRTRRTSAPSSSSPHSSFSPSLPPTPDSQTLQPYRRVSAYTSLPRRPSPLSGPPLIASSGATSSSHSHHSSSRPTAEGDSRSPPARPRNRGNRTSLGPRPQSELLVTSSHVTRSDSRRSVSVVGDDWTHAYEAVEYDLDLDLDFGRRLEFQRGATAEPTDHDDGHGSDSDTEAPEETDAMLRAGPKPVASPSTILGEADDSYGIADNASTRVTRHARTPSAGWQAWRADYDEDNFGVNTALSTSSEQTRLPSPSPPPSTSPTSDLLSPPVPAASAQALSPTVLSERLPTVHGTSGQTSMASINTDAPLPPLPSPVKSPLLERARSKSHESVSAPIAPPTPPDKPSTTLQEVIVSRGSSNAQSGEFAALSGSPHVEVTTEVDPSLQYTPLVPDLNPRSASAAPARAEAASTIRRSNEPAASAPVLSSAELRISPIGAQTLTEDRPGLSSDPPQLSPASQPVVDRPAPPFLVLSYKPPPSATSTAVKPSPGMPSQSLPLVAPAPAPVVVLSPSTPMQGRINTPPGGAPQLRSQSSSPSNLSQQPPLQTLKRPSSFPVTPRTSPPPSQSPSFPPQTLSPAPQAPSASPVHPWHTPRGSMILYHVALPPPSGARPGASHPHAYQSFGTLGAHATHRDIGAIRVGEDGALPPRIPSSSSGSPSSSALNLSSMNAGDVVAPPAPPPANRFSSHSYSRNSAYSVSADSVAAPSYTSIPPLEDRDGKYAVGLMVGTTKSAQSQFQTLPRVGTPLGASFALRDLKSNPGADAHSILDLNESARGSVLGGNGTGGPLVAYAYDPDEDDSDDGADGRGPGGAGGDWLHDPDVWPYADGDDDFHARRGDWKPQRRTWWGGKTERSAGGGPQKETGTGRKDDTAHLEMLGPASTTSRASMLKAPLQSDATPNASFRPRALPHSYLPPYKPPTILDTLLGRGSASVLTLVILVVGFLALFIIYPITQVFGPQADVAAKILGNTAINSTGQAVV